MIDTLEESYYNNNSVGNCGLYTGPWGVRVEDTNLVGNDGPTTLTNYPRSLAAG